MWDGDPSKLFISTSFLWFSCCHKIHRTSRGSDNWYRRGDTSGSDRIGSKHCLVFQSKAVDSIIRSRIDSCARVKTGLKGSTGASANLKLPSYKLYAKCQ
jgi:hypothetical protein